MKSLLLLLSIFVFWGSSDPIPPPTVTLQEAVDRELIVLDIKGNSNSPHYLKPIIVEVRSISNSSFVLDIPNGQRFLTLDATYQDLVVVKSERLAMAPGDEKSISLNAMCTQRENSSPSENIGYKLGPMAASHLLQVSKKVEELAAFNTVGQYAIWAISDDLGLEQIAGFNEAEAESLQQFVAEITGKEIPSKDPTDYLTNYNNPTLAKRTLGGKFEYGLAKTSAVTIGLFNEQNIIARELLNKPQSPRGDHDFSFEFDMEAYTDPVYFVRLIIDGEIKLSYKITS